jgi:copper chaperone CopZ
MCQTTRRAALLLALLVSCNIYVAANADEPGALGAALKNVVLRIEGMKCEECARTIERALRRARGVKSATVTRSDSKARVSFDPDQTSVSRLIELIGKIQGMAPYSAREAD